MRPATASTVPHLPDLFAAARRALICSVLY
jgi:hypothetical protein